MQGRDKLNRYDEITMNQIKAYLTHRIEFMLKDGVRPANIEIELIHHIKKILKGE